MITKSKIDPEKLIFESETEFLFWFKNTENLFEKTLILIEAEDWAKKKTTVKGIEVQERQVEKVFRITLNPSQ